MCSLHFDLDDYDERKKQFVEDVYAVRLVCFQLRDHDLHKKTFTEKILDKFQKVLKAHAKECRELAALSVLGDISFDSRQLVALSDTFSRVLAAQNKWPELGDAVINLRLID